MKINPLQDEVAASPAGASKAAAGAKPTAPAAAPATGTDAPAKADGVKVTRSMEAVPAGEVVDVDRVRAMREALEKGTFVVDADKIADALLQDAQEILSRVRR